MKIPHGQLEELRVRWEHMHRSLPKIERRGQNTYHEIIFTQKAKRIRKGFIEERPVRFVDTRSNNANEIRFMRSTTAAYANQVLLIAFSSFLVGCFGATSAGLALTAKTCKKASSLRPEINKLSQCLDHLGIQISRMPLQSILISWFMAAKKFIKIRIAAAAQSQRWPRRPQKSVMTNGQTHACYF